MTRKRYRVVYRGASRLAHVVASVVLSCMVAGVGFAADALILISEIQAEGGSAIFDDAIELVNLGDDPVDLGNWQVWVYDENDALRDQLVVPRYELAPSEVVVLVDGTLANYDNFIFYPGASVFWQANEAGACALVNPDDEPVDFVRWDGSGVAAPGGTTFTGEIPSSAMNPGTSLSRNSNMDDSDEARDFCLRPATLGSPEHQDECLSEVIVINEIAAVSTPPFDDKIELHNKGTRAHNIGNLRLIVYDENDALRDTLVLPSFVLQPGAYVVIHDTAGVNSADNLFFDGAAIFWQANEGGSVGLLDGSVHGIDFVKWDTADTSPPPGTAFSGRIRSSAMNQGTTLSRNANAVDTNRADDWCLRPSTMGAQNIDECMSEVIRISEISAVSVPPADDQIELYNAGSIAHNIGNLQLLIYDENNALRDTLVLPNFVLQPGGFVTIFDSAGVNNATEIYFDGAALFWQANEPGAVALLDGSMQGIDFVMWDEAAVTPPPGTAFNGQVRSSAMNVGTSLSRDINATDTDNASDWCLRPKTMGAENATECLSGVIRINEIQVNGVGPVDDQIELYNRGNVAHNIGNLQVLIYDQNDTLRDNLLLPSVVLPPGGFVVLNDRAGVNTATELFFDGAGIFWQEDEPGALALLDGSVHGIDFLRWDLSAVSPPPGTGWGGINPSADLPVPFSLSRRSDGVDTGVGSDWVIDPSTMGAPNPVLHFFQISDINPDQAMITFGIGGIELDRDLFLEVDQGRGWKPVQQLRPEAREIVERVEVPDGVSPRARFRLVE